VVFSTATTEVSSERQVNVSAIGLAAPQPRTRAAAPAAKTRGSFIRRCLRIRDLFYKLGLMSHSRQPTLAGGLELAVLLAAARLGQGAYGLEVRRELLERTNRDYAVGAVYTTLQRLEDKGFLKSRLSDPQPVRGGRSRRLFTLTVAGQRALRDAERDMA